VLLGLALPPANADTLRVVSYNALNFRGMADVDRLDDFLRVLRGIEPDVVAFQEIISEEAVDVLLSSIFLQINDDWAAAAFTNGRDTDNALLYRSSKVSLVSQRVIQTTLRDIAEYVLSPVGPDSALRFRLYSAHLKASQGCEERRREEAAILRQQLNMLPMGSLFMFVGDFNLYTSTEPAYQLLLSDTAGGLPNGQLFDPIDTPGRWNNSVTFAPVHTQSTTSLDDRFDFILVSEAFMDTAGAYVMPATYHAYGNDAQHFDRAINDGTNGVVPDSIADALYAASDHLPVVADFVIRMEPSSSAEPPSVTTGFDLVTCYPNPFNSTLTVEISPQGHAATAEIFDVLGRRIMQREFAGGRTAAMPWRVDLSPFGTGSYFVKVTTPVATQVRRVCFVR